MHLRRLVLASALTFLPFGTWDRSAQVAAASSDSAELKVDRVTTIAPFPRGLAMVGDELYVLSRGRVRGAGGVSAEVNDRAGTLWRVDPRVGQPVSEREVADRVRNNGQVFAEPTEPPFNLWNREAQPPEADRLTDRPYCTLRYHEPTKSFYLCCFSGIDKPNKPGEASFSKNLTDGLLRYDTRTSKWYEVERHNIAAGGSYPHHDVHHNPPPHGWLNGPDNCVALDNWLYAVAKDNSVLVRYDLTSLTKDPEAGPPPSELILDKHVKIKGEGEQVLFGHSALAYHAPYLYIGFRTSSIIARIKLDSDMNPVRPIEAEIVARFEPYDPVTGKSANLTDMDIDSEGRVYVISAQPSRVYRFRPDPKNVFDARKPDVKPWLDLAKYTGNPKMKSENVMVDRNGDVYVTSGDGYEFQYGAYGTVYRISAAGEAAKAN